MKTATVDIPFKLQVSKFIEALFPFRLQARYHINCVPHGSLVHCGEVLKVTWSRKLSDKCAAVIYVWNKELHINVRLNQTVRLIILWNIQEHSFKIPRLKFLRLDHCWYDEAADWHR